MGVATNAVLAWLYVLQATIHSSWRGYSCDALLTKTSSLEHTIYAPPRQMIATVLRVLGTFEAKDDDEDGTDKKGEGVEELVHLQTG